MGSYPVLSLSLPPPPQPQTQLHRAPHMTRAIGFDGLGEFRPSSRLTGPPPYVPLLAGVGRRVRALFKRARRPHWQVLKPRYFS